jgi:4-hydroxybenzoate polyprenyltransferase/phosphoserine phosphatase
MQEDIANAQGCLKVLSIALAQEAEPAAPLPPLAVDLDGTLVTVDSLHETFVGCLRLDPFPLREITEGLLRGKAAFKEEICARHLIDPILLPYNQELVAYLREQKRLGRTIGLFTAAHQSLAEAVARHLGLFSVVCASNGITNLRGVRKLKAIRDAFGERFAYAGDHAAVDRPIFEAAEQVILVGPVARLRKKLPKGINIEAEFSQPRADFAAWARALRLRHWSKNLLVFVPLILGLHFSANLLTHSLLLFLLFGLIASATYIVNDIVDLPADRRHHQKCLRPIASGAIPIRTGAYVALVLLVVAFAAGAALPWQAVVTLAGYLALTLAYSLALKRRPFVDVVVLAGLFTIRVLAGHVLIPGRVSPWLLTFSTLFFVGLAMVKRYAELRRVVAAGGTAVESRGYTAQDLPLLLASGVASAFAALAIFTVYLIADQYPRNVYVHPQMLWIMVPVLLLWTLRVWHLTVHGKMDEDPVVFALKDHVSLALGGAVGLALLAAWL